jgi:uncharacterized membrane protein
MNREQTMRLLTLTMILTFAIIAVSAGNLIVNPPDREADTEFYILSGNSSSTPVAGGYADRLRTGNGSIYVGIEHDLETSERFTVVVQLQEAYVVDNTTYVNASTDLDPIRISVEPETRTLHRIDFERLLDQRYSRVTFLLYQGSPPQNPSIQNAYRSAHVWVSTDTEADE